MSEAEQERIRRVYAAYDSDPSERGKRDGANPGLRHIRDERRIVMEQLLAREGMLPLTAALVLDVGCGIGDELAELRAFGAVDGNLHGVDLLADRMDRARAAYPEMKFLEVDGTTLPFPNATFDLVTANLVFSSILDDAVASRMAAEMSRVTKANGRIFVYDTRYPSPNPDVRAYGKRRLQQLFPGSELSFTALTVLPPLARFLGRRAPALLRAASLVPQLKSRYFMVVKGESLRLLHAAGRRLP